MANEHRTDMKPGSHSCSQSAAVSAFHDHVLAQPNLSSLDLARIFGRSEVTNPDKFADQLRRASQIFGIWNGEEFRYPTWQFAPAAFDPRVADLLELLPSGLDDRDGWRRAFWLYTGKAMLDDQIPVDLWATNAECVISAAREEFGTAQ